MTVTILMAVSQNNTFGYILGAILAVGILAYLVYTLIKPEKF